MTTPENPFDRPAAPPSASGADAYDSRTSAGQAPQSGWGPPPRAGEVAGTHGGWSGGTQTDVKAMVALGLAIAAYTPTIPFVGAIAALVLARMARRDIRASGGRLTGLSLCTWAVVLSSVHLVLVALAFLALASLFLLPFSFS
jgi:hypothetical protein